MKKKIALFALLALALMLAMIPAASAAGAWADDFDGYPTGANLHGMGGWKGWFNDPTFTAFTTDVQARSAPNSVDIVGNADLVHEYTNDDGFWVYRAWQYIPTAFAGTSYYIMLNQYDDAGATNNWSVQTNFNSATGLMTDDGSLASQPYIAGEWVEICLEIDLVNDTQVFYYDAITFYSGTWSNHISGGGITSIGAVDLFANGASSVYYDDMSLAEGAPGDCEVTGPTPTATVPPPTDTPVPTETSIPTETPVPTETQPPPTATATMEPPTDVELSNFGGGSDPIVVPYVIAAIVLVVGLGWFASRRRTS